MIVKIMKFLAFSALMLVTLLASASVNDRYWTETFKLKGGNYIQHKPHQVIYDNCLFAGESMTINGLYVRSDMTRAEFVTALLKSGQYPA